MILPAASRAASVAAMATMTATAPKTVCDFNLLVQIAGIWNACIQQNFAPMWALSKTASTYVWLKPCWTRSAVARSSASGCPGAGHSQPLETCLCHRLESLYQAQSGVCLLQVQKCLSHGSGHAHSMYYPRQFRKKGVWQCSGNWVRLRMIDKAST